MQTIQITGYTAEEFKRMLQEVADTAAKQAIEAFTKVKLDPNEEMTITQIADLWRCSKQTVTRRIRDHNVPTVKLGRDVAIKRKFMETIKNPIAKD